MQSMSAFAAYKNLSKKSPKKTQKNKDQLEPKKKHIKTKSKEKHNGAVKKRKIPQNDSRLEEENILPYEQFIGKGLEECRSDSTISNDGSYDEAPKKKMPSKRVIKREASEPTSLKKQKSMQVDKNHQANENGFEKKQNNHSPSKISKSTLITSKVMKSNVPTENMDEFLANNAVDNVTKMNSLKEGESFLQWIISPITVKDFFSSYWEENTLLIKREKPDFYASIISFSAIDQMLLDHHVEFTKNIDVTTYENGVRETHNPEGRALPPAVWDFYRDGCSVRLLNPQTFLKPLHELCATLQEFFHCLVGANAYLTPPNSQGFAPHYDDIEAFVLQIEGRKRWKVYSPRSVSEMLPRYSSKNFSQSELGEPILDQVLEPGDLLYFPRGAIHQACTEPGYHSLHITLSVYQKQSYADLLEKMLPAILKSAIDSNVNLRRGLPLSIWHNAGLVYTEVDTSERAFLKRKVTKIIGECLQSVQLSEVMDAAVDELAKKFQHEALPPVIKASEKPYTIFGLRNEPHNCGDCPSNFPLELRTNVRLLRANILRLVAEEGQIRIYYYLDNSKEYCEFEPNFFEIEPILAASVEVLIKSYPEYMGVSQFPLDDDDSKLELATCLWKRGLLMTEKPIRN